MSTSKMLRVKLEQERNDSYDILIGADCIEQYAKNIALSGTGHRYALLCDSNTRTYAERIQTALADNDISATILEVLAGEKTKSLATFGQLQEDLLTHGFTRKDALIAVGGGMVGDLGGFVAGTYMRGIPFIQVPTTLLSQVDSSVGGKVAVNLPSAKNYCGLFYQPKQVCIDVETLSTLPPRELLSGLAEVIKYGVIRDRELFKLLGERHKDILDLEPELIADVIRTCCAIKASVVEEDERESGTRMILNYGHTVGHAIEDTAAYALTHGECVAYGMRIIARAANMLGQLSNDDFEAHEALLDVYNMAMEPLDLDIEAIMSALVRDKKATAGTIRYVVPHAIGKVEVQSNLDPEVIRKALVHVAKGRQ